MSRDAFISFAQNHEDVVLARALQPDQRPGFWIDVGAGDPVADSVTAAFSARGWRGINVEPLEPEHTRLCEARPLDVNLRLALAATPGTGKLFIGPPENRGASTLRPEVAERYQAEGQEFEQTEVVVGTLADVVAEFVSGPVDFLKVDVEGSEREVLAGTDWSSFHPRIVVVEATIPNSRQTAHEEWEPILIEVGYEFALFDGLNRFYARRDEHQVIEALAAPANVFDNYIPHSANQMEAAYERLMGEYERMAPDLQNAYAAARYAEDEITIADECIVSLRDELAQSQFRTAKALRDREVFLTELRSLHASRIFRHTARLRSTLYRLRRLGRFLSG